MRQHTHRSRGTRLPCYHEGAVSLLEDMLTPLSSFVFFLSGFYLRPQRGYVLFYRSQKLGGGGGSLARLVNALDPKGRHPCGAGGPCTPRASQVNCQMYTSIHPIPPSTLTHTQFLKPCLHFSTSRGLSRRVGACYHLLLCCFSAACGSLHQRGL